MKGRDGWDSIAGHMVSGREVVVLLVACAALAGAVGARAAPLSAQSTPPLHVRHEPREAPQKSPSGKGSYGWASFNWSGYAITGQTYTSITGSWIVPAAGKTQRTFDFSSDWIGIDGFNNGDLIQTGTGSDYYTGLARYRAWWQILPAGETPISSMVVSAGDVMTASVVKTDSTNNLWTITINDVSRSESYSTVQTYTGPLSSAEWIVEAPTVSSGAIAPLSHYGTTAFDPGTVNGGSPGLVAADGGAMFQRGKQVSTPSVPDSDQDGFTMRYGSSTPGAPSS